MLRLWKWHPVFPVGEHIRHSSFLVLDFMVVVFFCHSFKSCWFSSLKGNCHCSASEILSTNVFQASSSSLSPQCFVSVTSTGGHVSSHACEGVGVSWSEDFFLCLNTVERVQSCCGRQKTHFPFLHRASHYVCMCRRVCPWESPVSVFKKDFYRNVCTTMRNMNQNNWTVFSSFSRWRVRLSCLWFLIDL